MGLNYNDAVFLWENYPAERPVRINDGHAFVNGEGYIARFDNDAHAERVLAEAGYSKSPDGWWRKSTKKEIAP